MSSLTNMKVFAHWVNTAAETLLEVTVVVFCRKSDIGIKISTSSRRHALFWNTHSHPGFSVRPHTLHIQTPFIFSYWLLLYPVAWLDHTRQHRTSSVFLPCSLAPTHSLLPYPNAPPPSPHPPTQHHPSRVCLSLPFISPAYWTPPLASKRDALAVWPLLHINPYLPPCTFPC